MPARVRDDGLRSVVVIRSRSRGARRDLGQYPTLPDRRVPMWGSRCGPGVGVGLEVQRQPSSGNQRAISRAADSGESEP